MPAIEYGLSGALVRPAPRLSKAIARRPRESARSCSDHSPEWPPRPAISSSGGPEPASS